MLYGILAPSDVTAATGEQVRAVAASFVAADCASWSTLAVCVGYRIIELAELTGFWLNKSRGRIDGRNNGSGDRIFFVASVNTTRSKSHY